MTKNIIQLIIILMSTFSAKASIHRIDNANEIIPYLKNLEQNDIVSFDVKNVLFEPIDQVLRPNHRKVVKTHFKNLKDELGDKQTQILESIMLASYKPVLVDEEMPAIIKKIQRQGFKTVALTSGKSGPFFHIQSRENMRLKTLKDLGIDFSNSFTEANYISFEDIKHPFLFKDGVIFTNRAPKGGVLVDFLAKIDTSPNYIIHVDNSLNKLLELEETFKNHEVNFIGLHFVKAYADKTPLNQEIADKKFEILKEQQRWISDETAAKLLNAHNSCSTE